ncbi:MAG: DegT/DnrJ/EryC1/StrS family aminotransferase [Planctomycetota bacterium]|nr:MAG: DegT/DnrJ/EryC1/StrS family aminotransferase [Planctomycetota bacterium]
MIDDIPLSRPEITQDELALVDLVLRSDRLAAGPMVEEFEALIARRTGRRHAVAVSSGTAGLHLALLACGIGPGDEVVTTPFSFIASSNCILYTGATPVFVDIDPVSLNMDPARVESAITPRTRAILAVEVFGNPAHLDACRALAAKHEIPLIEDACEGLGGAWRGRAIGSFGRVAVFGFYPNKQITTGEGGMIVTDDDAIADACRSMRNQGRALEPAAAPGAARLGMSFRHDRLGFNYRMSDVNAALGVGQMRRLDGILEARDLAAREYMRLLMDTSDIILPTVDGDTRMSWFVFVVRLADEYTEEERDRIIEGLRRHDIGAAAYFPCIHLQPFYRARFGFEPGSFPIAERTALRTIALPFFTRISRREIDLVSQTLKLMIGRENIKRS